MKILFLSTSMGQGGADKQIFVISQELQRRGYIVKIVSLTPLGPMGEQARAVGLNIKSLNLQKGKFSLSNFRTLFSEVRTFSPDALITFMFHANVLGKIIGKLSGCKKVITSVRNEYFGSKLREKIEKHTDFLSDVTTTNSKVASTSLIQRGIFKEKKLIVIPNAIDINPTVVGKNSNSTFKWIAIGRLRPQKGYFNLLGAVSYLAKKYNLDFRLNIIGKGNMFAELNNYVSELDIGEYVKFSGPSQNVGEIISECDGVVLSSDWEGLPNVLMESHSYGKPIVSTNVGGVKEIVEDKVTGFLVPRREPMMLADAMFQLMQLDDLARQEMGTKGREKMKKKFSVASVADQWEEIIKE